MDQAPVKTQSSAAEIVAAPAVAPQHKKREFISPGEHIHRWATYLSIDWLFNTATGVSFAMAALFTKTGQKYWTQPIRKGFTALLSPVIKNEESLAASVGKGGDFLGIIAGGMFTIPPLMVLEHRKVRTWIVERIDDLVYGKDKASRDPKISQSHDEMFNAPKKDFKSGMVARGLALAPLLTMVLYPPTRELSKKVYFNRVADYSEKVAGKFGFGKAFFKDNALGTAEQKWKHMHTLVAMDFGLGVPYAILHSIFYNMVSGHRDKKAQECKAQGTIAESLPLPVTQALAAVTDSGPAAKSHTARLGQSKTPLDHAAIASSVSPGFGAAR